MYICPKCIFTPVPICKHLGETSIGHLGFPFPPIVNLHQVPICEHFGEMGPGHLRYPFRALWVPLSLNVHFPNCPFAPLPICKHLRRKGHRNIRALKVPLSQMSICHGAHFHQCSIPPNIYFPLIPIYPIIHFSHLPQVPIYSLVPIYPKCPFTPNSLPQVVPLHTQVASLFGLTPPPFVQDLFVRNSIVRDPFVPDPFVLEPKCLGPICPRPNRPGLIHPGPIRPGAHLSKTYLSGTHLPRTHLSGTHLPGNHLPGAQMSRTHLS